MAISDSFSDVLTNRWANCLLYLNLRKGAYADLSSFVQTVAPISLSSGNWENHRGWAIRARSIAQYLVVTHTPALSLLGGGTIVHMHPERPLTGALEMYVSKTDAGGVSRSYDFGPTNSWLNGWIATSNKGYKSSAMAWTHGGQLIFYADGVPSAPIAGATSTASNENVFISVLPGNPGSSLSVANHAVLIFDTQLTGAELAQLHTDWLYSPFAL